MPDTFSYRPKSHSVSQLKKIAQKHHASLNRYIESAIVEKIANEEMESIQDSSEQLARKITKVIVEHMGVKLSRPNKVTHNKINHKFEETERKGRWVSDEATRPGR